MSARLRFIAIVLCLAAVGIAGAVAGQGRRRAGQRAETQRGRANQGDPEATRLQMMQRMQQQLGAADTEWQVIQPKLQKVMELSRQINRRGAGGLLGRPGGRRNSGQRVQRPDGQARQPRNNSNRAVSDVQKAAAELQTLLNNANADPEQVKAKLTELRQVRETAQQNLAQARTELQQILSVKQEARLVLMGLLE